ncbi:hypothetical protein IFT48_02045 [Pseudomonas fluorescens]|nr:MULTISPECIES: hypothetical protein [Pseudomonas]MBD8088744.1 hypothetical protein [Pseudomonas fluorescens]MBD8614795.1 hypothetical protein [Pseudomonas putida]MBD8681521.1 hypothetical protein [Pseudomonas sp. CFBP 13719]
MPPASTPDIAEPTDAPEVPTHPIEQIRALITQAKSAIWKCEAPEVLEPMLKAITLRIAELPALGNPQAIAPLTQQFLSLIETKPEGTPNGQSVLVMVRLLGYTPEFVKIYSRDLAPDVLNEIIGLMARDPLMVSDLKSTRMLCQLARRGANPSLGLLFDRMLSLKTEAGGPNILEALNHYMAEDNCDIAVVCDLIYRHRDYLWSIPDFKAKTVGVTGVGFLSPKAALLLYRHGEVELAKDLVKVMCREAVDPNHYYYLAEMGEAPNPEYFNARFAKQHIFCEDVLYSIQNCELELPHNGLKVKQGDNNLMRKLIDRLPKLHLDSDVEQDRMIEVMEALSADHPLNKQLLAKSGVSKELLMRVQPLRDIVFAADLGL